jgi:hypothetical protein
VASAFAHVTTTRARAAPLATLHEVYGYFAHGIGPETFKAPDGWQQRLIRAEVAWQQRSALPRKRCCFAR